MKTDLEHWNQHQALKRTNPHAAALYLNEHGDAVFRGRPAPAVTAPTVEQQLASEIAARGVVAHMVQRETEADTAALLAFADYEKLKRTNPHAAALRLNDAADLIYRGRELAAAVPPEPEPPQAA